MFHAPSSETKQRSDRTRMQAQQRPDFSARWPSASAHTPIRSQLARLHSTYGNQAVLRMLSQSASAIQTKLAVNKPGDEFEQEADRVANQVIRMPAPAIQRKCSSCEEEEKLQRKCAECEEEEKKTGLRRKEAGTQPQFAPPSVHAVLNSPGHPLDPATRAFMEPRFGHDFRDVRVHTDAKAAESARAVNALAYTVGQHLVFGPAGYVPDTESGRRLLAHELAHVIQQSNAAPPTVMREDAEPQSSLDDCNEQCGKQFEECKGKRDQSICVGELNFCLNSCAVKNAPKKKPKPASPAPAPPPPPQPSPSAPKAKTKDYQLSGDGKKFIASPPNEGFCPNLYDDATPNCGRGKGNCTIGIGRLVHSGPCDGSASERPYEGGVTLEAEIPLFTSKLSVPIQLVNDGVKVELTQCQFDALVSFAYNANKGGLDQLLPTINAGKFEDMPDLIKKTTTNGDVLKPRRNREADLFANCNYKPTK